jgi:PhnB protein
MSTAKPVPEGFRTVTPYLVVPDGTGAIDFYKRAFGVVELGRHTDPSGRIMHALLKIGDSHLMLGESKDVDARGEKTFPRVSVYLYVENVDALAQQAIDAGAKVIMPVADQFYGDRSGGVEDPYGVVWWISTHIEDVPEEELQRRAAAHRQHAS